MRLKLTGMLLAVALAATPLLADPALFAKYEKVRQGLLSGSLKDAQATARELSAAAGEARNAELQAAADALAKSPDLKKARAAFGPVSAEMIKLRAVVEGEKPAVAYCPMVNKSWLQERGPIGNPYDAAMAKCGVFKKD